MSKAMPSIPKPAMEKFLLAMESIYGPFPSSDSPEIATWKPPATAEGHKGRYLWTDGFAVTNFLTLYKLTNDGRYLTFARSLVQNVHDVLGYTRDGQSRLPGATEAYPLNGGLRIGKHDEAGSDGDGQYFHYLTVWMFALNRMTQILGDIWYNEQAINMARAVLPSFMYKMNSTRPRMYWKLTVDMSKPLVAGEGNLDPIDGYVMYKLLQETAASLDNTKEGVLGHEITLLKKVVDTKWKNWHSTDPLDIGMTLWTVHWLKEPEQWALTLQQSAASCLDQLVRSGYFDAKAKSPGQRLAFREFGTALGVRCLLSTDSQAPPGSELGELPQRICKTWEEVGLVPVPTSQQKETMAELMPITAVMYAAALFPGSMMLS
ncbi:uncharacterized protein A1O9_02500 [Exophiala aquamarina CBS 119918]|uniref:L-ascorbic acid binding protein n=1 Tax=Exophiala aquamarina CBS 119918 TaxID=1182545 RepID=A0A072PM28_9EURO|nr:uncharacterized protein A1O9_02500 [Exophiala aquamarina CBS 119918]KEF60936.1 hypothetical protein A1O9_02500 [Exophiala aquamarina CBS 119918]